MSDLQSVSCATSKHSSVNHKGHREICHCRRCPMAPCMSLLTFETCYVKSLYSAAALAKCTTKKPVDD